MKNLNIGKKLTICFAALTGIVMVVLTLAFINMKQMDGRFDQVMKRDVLRVETTNKVIKIVNVIFHGVSINLMTKEKDVAAEWTKITAEKRGELLKALETLDKLEQTGRGKELLAQYREGVAKGRALNNKTVELSQTGKNKEAVELYIRESLPSNMDNIATLQRLEDYQNQDMEAARAKALEQSATYRLLLIIFGIVTLGCGIAATFLLKRSITVPLAESVRIADRLAKGELDVQVTADRKDEVGKLLGSMKNMVDKWRGVIGQITETASRLSSAATELSASAEQMSKGSATQAERTAVVSTSSEEMSQTVLDVAKNAGSISMSAGDTANTARQGETIVNRAAQEVKEIASTVNDSSRFVHSLGERSKQIGEIVGVINDIADQTNLLALNAAIEAARAGEQGRGFAVVADEVRKLAERTGQATSEIGTMIKSVQDEVGKAVEIMASATSKVDQGVRLSEEAGSALASIVTSVNDLQTIMQHIASATEEMSATSEEITREIEQIAIISRETSSSSEQTAQASGELATLSATLQNIVREFRL